MLLFKIRAFSFWWKGFFTCLKVKSHYRSSHRRCSERRGVLRNSQNSQEKNLCQSLFFNKVAGFSHWKERLSIADVFKWILWSFQEHLFYRTEHLCYCFCHYEKTEPFTTKYLSHKPLSAWRNSLSGSNLGERCPRLFMFSRLHF